MSTLYVRLSHFQRATLKKWEEPGDEARKKEGGREGGRERLKEKENGQ